MKKLIISTSGDHIFNVGTQSTHHSLRQAVKSNLARRMVGFDVNIKGIKGDPNAVFVHLGLSTSFEVDGVMVEVCASAIADRTTMDLHEVSIACDSGLLSRIMPSQMPRLPEEVAQFMTQLAQNVVRNNGQPRTN